MVGGWEVGVRFEGGGGTRKLDVIGGRGGGEDRRWKK